MGFIEIGDDQVGSSGLGESEQQAFSPSPGKHAAKRTATTRPEAEKRIPLAWNETHEISFWQEPECD